MTLKTKDDYLAKGIEALEQRTPIDIINEAGFDLRKGAPLRGLLEGEAIVVAISDQNNESEVKKQARETLFILAGVVTVLISIGTISFQSIKAAKTNPAEILRNE